MTVEFASLEEVFQKPIEKKGKKNKEKNIRIPTCELIDPQSNNDEMENIIDKYLSKPSRYRVEDVTQKNGAPENICTDIDNAYNFEDLIHEKSMRPFSNEHPLNMEESPFFPNGFMDQEYKTQNRPVIDEEEVLPENFDDEEECIATTKHKKPIYKKGNKLHEEEYDLEESEDDKSDVVSDVDNDDEFNRVRLYIDYIFKKEERLRKGKSRNMLLIDFLLYVFGGIFLIFIMEQIFYLGIQYGANSNLK